MNIKKINGPSDLQHKMSESSEIRSLIFDQPNLSTTLLVLVVFLFMLYVAKISYKWILGTLAVLVPFGAWFIYYIQQEGQKLLQPYQVNRIMSWINPSKYPADNTSQQMNSIMAIGSGQLHGKGLANTTLASVKNGNFLAGRRISRDGFCAAAWPR